LPFSSASSSSVAVNQNPVTAAMVLILVSERELGTTSPAAHAASSGRIKCMSSSVTPPSKRVMQSYACPDRLGADERELVAEYQMVSGTSRQNCIQGALGHASAVVQRVDRVAISPVHKLIIIQQEHFNIVPRPATCSEGAFHPNVSRIRRHGEIPVHPLCRVERERCVHDSQDSRLRL
jgi:hypothetical protein